MLHGVLIVEHRFGSSVNSIFYSICNAYLKSVHVPEDNISATCLLIYLEVWSFLRTY